MSAFWKCSDRFKNLEMWLSQRPEPWQGDSRPLIDATVKIVTKSSFSSFWDPVRMRQPRTVVSRQSTSTSERQRFRRVPLPSRYPCIFVISSSSLHLTQLWKTPNLFLQVSHKKVYCHPLQFKLPAISMKVKYDIFKVQCYITRSYIILQPSIRTTLIKANNVLESVNISISDLNFSTI